MAHVSTRINDFTHPIKNNGSFNVAVKKALLATFRALFGKTVTAAIGNTSSTTTTAQNIAGLSFRVKKNKTYRIQGKLLCTSDATGGAKPGIALSGASAPTLEVSWKYFLAATMAAQKTVAIGNATGLAGAVLEIDFDGYIVPDVSGFLNITHAQIAANAASTVNLGSWCAVTRVQG